MSTERSEQFSQCNRDMDHDRTQAFRKIGTIVKVHGLKGEVLVDPEVDLPQLLEEQRLFYIKNRRDDLEPGRVERSYLANKKGRPTFFVKFESVDDRIHAENLVRCDLYVVAELYKYMMINNDDRSADDFVGYVVIDEGAAPCGEVIDVIKNPAHPILRISSDNGTYMIPFVDEYILSVDDDQAVIHGRNLKPLMEV